VNLNKLLKTKDLKGQLLRIAGERFSHNRKPFLLHANQVNIWAAQNHDL